MLIRRTSPHESRGRDTSLESRPTEYFNETRPEFLKPLVGIVLRELFSAGCSILIPSSKPVDCVTIGGVYQGERTTCDAGCGFGNSDADGDVDLDDLAEFQRCFSG